MPSHIQCPNKSCHAKIQIDASIALTASISGGMICPTCGQNIPDSEFVTQGIIEQQPKGTPDSWRGKMIIK